jgi:RNA-directed DNA polymerase
MPDWSPQRYRYEGVKLGVYSDTLNNAISIIKTLNNADPRLPIVFTLRHLSILTGASLSYLRNVVRRSDIPYKTFYLRKHMPGRNRFRTINVPDNGLLDVQSWISDNILRYTNASEFSFAYHPSCRPIFAITQHCGCKWLVKVDI